VAIADPIRRVIRVRPRRVDRNARRALTIDRRSLDEARDEPSVGSAAVTTDWKNRARARRESNASRGRNELLPCVKFKLLLLL
jgi:hypothetical protein